MEEKIGLINAEVRVYRRRWYILFLFSFLALFNCTVWNTFGPIVDTMETVYPTWTDSTISLLTNWCPIAFLVFLLPVLYISERSLRLAQVLSSGLVLIGAASRCVFLVYPDISDEAFTILCHVGAILNGIPAIVVTSIPAAVSAAWFPPHERVTATSISQMLNNIGTAVSFLMAELMVPEVPATPDSLNNATCTSVTSESNSNISLITAGQNKELRHHVNNYLLALMGPAALICAFSVIYFPSKPPLPPSRSSTHERLDFVRGIWQLILTPSAWVIALVWSIPQAVWNNWCALMVVSLTKTGMDGECLTERWVNMLGIVAVLVGTGVAILCGMATDKIKGNMKRTIVSLLAAGGVTFTFLSLITDGLIRLPSMTALKVGVYVLLLLGNSMVVSTSPLCMEFAVEKMYPVPEGIVGGWLNIWYNIISVFFLFLFNIPHIGTQWLNYVLPISCFLVLPLLCFLKEEYKRRVIDDTPDSQPDSETEEEEHYSPPLIL